MSEPQRHDAIFAEIVRRAAQFSRNIDQPTLRRAYLFASARHAGKFRRSNEPYITHPLEVTRILTDLRLDTQTLAAAILHDVVEDTDTPLEEVRIQFGDDVALIVDGVTKLSTLHLLTRERQQIDNFRKMLLSIAKDVRVLLVKFADRLHNMRTLEHMPVESRVRISRETLEVYAPLAHRFGMARIRRELEDAAFQFLYPAEHAQLKERIDQLRTNLTAYLDALCEKTRAALAERGLRPEVQGRIKHLYSIYRKMIRQSKDISEIYDLLAMRVIVEDTDECYRALSYLHQKYLPLQGRFKDFIGQPKPNGYQSLHTTVVADDGMVVEVQIRTARMHEVAEEGIARHWLYKEGRVTHDIDLQTRWVRQFLEWAESVEDAQEFVDQLQIDLFPDELFVLTPKGDIKTLPAGASALDFAFAVHTEVGMRCTTALVNGVPVPLGHKLQSCDTVKIITSNTQKPTRDWLSLVKTSKARSKIRLFLRDQEYEFNLAVGRELLEKRLRKLRMDVTEEEWQAAAESFNVRDADHLFAAVGGGQITVDRVWNRLRMNRGKEGAEEPTPADRAKAETRDAVRTESGIVLSEIESPMVRIARCCHPVPGDEVFGFITRGRGITVHKLNCSNAEGLRHEPDRIVAVRWEDPLTLKGPGPFSIGLTVRTQDRIGILSQIAGALADLGADVRHAEVHTGDHKGTLTFQVEVKNEKQLRRIISKLRRNNGVIDVRHEVSAPRNGRERPLRADPDAEGSE